MRNLSNSYEILRKAGMMRLDANLWNCLSKEKEADKVKNKINEFFVPLDFSLPNIVKNGYTNLPILKTQLINFLKECYFLLWELHASNLEGDLKKRVDTFISKKCETRMSFILYHLPLLSLAKEARL